MSRLVSLLWAVMWGACFFTGAGGAAFSLGVAGITPMVGPGHVDSYTASCTSSRVLLQSPYGQVAYRAFVDDAADEDIYFGDAEVTTSIGEPVGAGEKIGGNVRSERCIVGTGPETVRVRAMVATAPDGFVGRMMRSFYETFHPEMFEARLEG